MAIWRLIPGGPVVNDGEETAQRMIPGGPLQQTVQALRCIVLKDGALQELPASAPYGARLILTAGVLTAAPSGGTSLVYDRTLAAIRQAAAGEAVLTP
jgi:hypothetical protein